MTDFDKLPCGAQVGDARVGDTIIAAGTQDEVEALPGYTEARPVLCWLASSFSAMLSGP